MLSLSQLWKAAMKQRQTQESRAAHHRWLKEGGWLDLREALALAELRAAQGAARVRIARYRWPDELRYGVDYCWKAPKAVARRTAERDRQPAER